MWLMRGPIGERNLFELVKDYLLNRKNLIGIEIGCYAGESTSVFLRSNAFRKFYCVDPWIPDYDSKTVITRNDLIEAEKVFDRKFANSDIVTKVKMKSDDAVSLFANASIDFLYIDGDHNYESVRNDILHYVPKVKSDGIISGHDYTSTKWTGVKQAVDEYFQKPPLKIYHDSSWLYIKE